MKQTRTEKLYLMAKIDTALNLADTAISEAVWNASKIEEPADEIECDIKDLHKLLIKIQKTTRNNIVEIM